MDDDTAPPAVDRTIGRRLGEVRAWRGLSLRAAAELAGFSASYLSMIERGLRPVDKRSTLEALANALRVAPSELTGTPYPPTDTASSEAHAAISALRRALVGPPRCHRCADPHHCADRRSEPCPYPSHRRRSSS